MTFQPIVERLLEELEEIGQVIDRIKEGLQKLEQTDAPLYTDSIALNLHGFYNGLERVFEQIAKEIDGNLPGGEQWHHELILQMEEWKGPIHPRACLLPTRKHKPTCKLSDM